MEARTVEAIEGLKRCLGRTRDCTQPLERYLDCVRSDPALIEGAEPHESPTLSSMIATVAGVMLGRRVPAVPRSLLRVPSQHLVQGSLLAGDQKASVLWFEDLRQGLFILGTRCVHFGELSMPRDPRRN